MSDAYHYFCVLRDRGQIPVLMVFLEHTAALHLTHPFSVCQYTKASSSFTTTLFPEHQLMNEESYQALVPLKWGYCLLCLWICYSVAYLLLPTIEGMPATSSTLEISFFCL